MGTTHLINIFSITFLSPDNHNKSQAIICRVSQFPCENTLIISDFKLQGIRKTDTVAQHYTVFTLTDR